MTTLVIPDIHNAVDRAEEAIARLEGRFDDIVLLGDYFDDFGDREQDAVRTATWLERSLRDPRRTHLVGNHDLAYFWPNRFTYCSGFEHEKMRAIAPILSRVDRRRLKAAVLREGWLLSHAGVHPTYACGRSASDLVQWLEVQLLQLGAGGQPAILAPGQARGGCQEFGGITWLDWFREFQPVSGVNQIVGHTPAQTVRVYWMESHRQHVHRCAHQLDRPPSDVVSIARCDSANICLDTQLRAVALVSPEEIRIVPIGSDSAEQVVVTK